jgi:hypothetical protein
LRNELAEAPVRSVGGRFAPRPILHPVSLSVRRGDSGASISRQTVPASDRRTPPIPLTALSSPAKHCNMLARSVSPLQLLITSISTQFLVN